MLLIIIMIIIVTIIIIKMPVSIRKYVKIALPFNELINNWNDNNAKCFVPADFCLQWSVRSMCAAPRKLPMYAMVQGLKMHWIQHHIKLTAKLSSAFFFSFFLFWCLKKTMSSWFRDTNENHSLNSGCIFSTTLTSMWFFQNH